uniref:Uncharacterized protein n=1 Tax=Plectus sambesii TaxID=2011161 RepID=A0A914W9D8_9BILA
MLGRSNRPISARRGRPRGPTGDGRGEERGTAEGGQAGLERESVSENKEDIYLTSSLRSWPIYIDMDLVGDRTTELRSDYRPPITRPSFIGHATTDQRATTAESAILSRRRSNSGVVSSENGAAFRPSK